jgi:hypothetical protein
MKCTLLLVTGLLFFSIPALALPDESRHYRTEFAITMITTYLIIAAIVGGAVWLLSKRTKRRLYQD